MTNNIDRRLSEHNSYESNTRTTMTLIDYELIFYQMVNSRKMARLLERYLKSGSGRENHDEIVEYLSADA